MLQDFLGRTNVPPAAPKPLCRATTDKIWVRNVGIAVTARRKDEFGAMPECFRLTQQGQFSDGGIAKRGFDTSLCHSTV